MSNNITNLDTLEELMSHVDTTDANNNMVLQAYFNTINNHNYDNDENLLIQEFLSQISYKCSYWSYDDYKNDLHDVHINDIITLLQTVSLLNVIMFRPDLLISINKHTNDKADEYSDYWADNYGSHIITDGSHDDLLIRKTAFIICKPDYDSMMKSEQCLQSWFHGNDEELIRFICNLIIEHHYIMVNESIDNVICMMQSPYDFTIDDISKLHYSIRMSPDWYNSLKMKLIRMLTNDNNSNVHILRMQTWAVRLAVFFNDNEPYHSLNSCLHYDAGILINALKQVYPMRMMPFETQYEAFKTYLINNSNNE